MKALLPSIISTVIALLLGGSGMYWYDRYHPETTVYSDVDTTSIPLRDSSRHQAQTSITLRNASARKPATALGLAIRIRTGSLVQVGEIATPELSEDVDVDVVQPKGVYYEQARESQEAQSLSESGNDEPEAKQTIPEAAEWSYATIHVRAPRLAPRSEMVIPIWWESGPGPPRPEDVEVQGTADQCVITAADVPRNPWNLISLIMMVVCILALIVLWGFTTRDLSARRIERRNESEAS